jgi:RHS repeat-associated protein
MKANYIIRKYLLLTILYMLGMHIDMQAQNVPVSVSHSSATSVSSPIPYQNTAINYIRLWEPSMPTADTAVVKSPSRTVSEVKQTNQYFDGLGRPLQTVIKGVSASGKDLVSPVVYDAYGHEQYKYLPYAQQTINTNDGKFKIDPFNNQKNFYDIKTLNPGASGDTIYYSQTAYELSPLNRILKVYAPGNSWAKEGGNHPAETQYLINTVADSVRVWNMGTTIPTSTSIYAAGTLQKNVLIDENGNQNIEYKDIEGRVILKKNQFAVMPGTAHIGWLCTYNAYDDLGNLRFVIPPLAVEMSMRAGWNVSTIADELCFQYQYDSRYRMTSKKIPGSGPVYLIYDTRDRLVFTQDAVQRLKSPQEWLVSFYDGLNRPTMTAIYKANTTQAALQASLNAVTSSTQSINYVFPATADLVLGGYDGSSNYTATNSITFQDNFDSGTGAEFLAEINAAGTGGATTISATNPLPAIPSTALTPLTFTYYDNYNYAGVLSYQTEDLTKLQAGVNLNPYAETLPATPSTMTNGIVTGTKVRILDTDQWLTTTIYYNDKGRMIQVSSNNSTGGKDIVTDLYDFSGKVLSSYLRHTNPHSGPTPKITMLTMMAYDAIGRLVNIKKRLNDITGQDKTIVANTYDELGQLKQKRLGVTGTSTQLDSINYTYNIRGWLQGINKDLVNTAGSTISWFGQEINYDYGFTANQYNGNISGTKWKSKSDGISRAYGYSYDRVSRLTTADFSQQNTGGASWTRDAMNFSVSNLAYDANGNIAAMKQVGLIGTAVDTIDRLTYTYAPGSNKLMAVADPSSTATAKLGDFINGTNTGNDYNYDGNGNLITDQNKGISAITYNQLNLPANIVITGKGSISYQYDAIGTKLKKTVVDNTVTPSKTTVTDYIGGFMYKQDTLQYVSHEEGRIRPVYKTGQAVSFSYDYFEKDHLGNIRLVLTDQTDFTMYVATMETEAAATETALFSNIEETKTETPVGYPEGKSKDQNAFVAKLNPKAGGNKIGPSLVLRVMAGDTVKIHARAFYKSIGPKDKAKQHPTEEMVAGLLQAFGGHTGDDSHGAIADNNTPLNSNFYNNDYQRLKEKDPDGITADRPKAYLNFVLFDDQFKLVDENSGVRQVKSAPDELQELGTDQMVAATSGFLYVYTSNETEQDVFFDDVTVAVNSGPLLEETHYYPFGLAMAGISSNALKGMNYPENSKKYNGIEFNGDLDLNEYEAFYRTLDPQIGRWNQIDTRPNYAESPYAAMSNIPVSAVDPLGDTTQYFSSNGTLLFVANDKLKNSVTVIPDANAGGFGLIMGLLNTKLGAKLKDSDRFNTMLRGTGISYPAEDYFQIYDYHQYDVYTGDSYTADDGKPLINEYRIRLYNDNGVMTARGEDDKAGTPGMTILGPGDAQALLHTHAAEGRKTTYKDGRHGAFGVGAAAMETDIANSTNVKPGSGYFNIVVTKSEVRLFNTSGIVITIDRNGSSFKKNKK